MKKISLMVVFAGIISAATFANVHHTLITPQKGKAQKAQPVAAPKPQKAEPVVNKPVARPAVTTPAPAKAAPIVRKTKPVKKTAMATGAMQAIPVAPQKK